MNPLPDPSEVRELDARSANGIDVRLLWQASANNVLLYVADARSGEEVVLVVPGVDALEAFRHPFAYISARSRGWSALITADIERRVTTLSPEGRPLG